MTLKLGLDIGTNSIGWCLLDGEHIAGLGVRIFSDGRESKSGTSLAVDRRAARAMRRRRDRYLRRRTALLNRLVQYGLLPDERSERHALQGLNPYELRARALDEELPLHHIGRALFQLNQRRGFKSNRKTDKGDPDSGKISLGVSKLREAMEADEARTVGEFLWRRLQNGQSVRVRLREGEGPETSRGGVSDGYSFYPERAMLEDEFHEIWNAQAPYHRGVLTPDRRDALFKLIFYQRPLKPPEVGLCTLLGTETGERRLPRSDPLFQQRRLLEELNALTIERGPGTTPERLTREQRDRLLLAMRGKKSAAFSSLRRVLKLGDAVFNKERAGRDKLLGDEVFAELARKDRYGPSWSEVPVERQREIVTRLREMEDGKALVKWLMDEIGLEEERARAVAGSPLPDGYGRFGETATRALIRELTNHDEGGRVCVYSEAVAAAPELRHHSDFRTGEVMDRLPYYGEVLERHIIPGTGLETDPVETRIGKLTNPTVHIGLNQLRRLVNEIIETFGHPDEILVEIARELKTSERQRKEIESRQKRDRLAAERRSQYLTDELNEADTGTNRALLRLWEELNPENPFDRRCVYTGELICARMLFSGETDVDHILPWSRTLDDSNANKLICLARANRDKRNKTPHERWGGTREWEGMLERAAKLPRNKAWRFNPDAMDRFDEQGGFLARHLTDTQYLSRLARAFLEAVAPGRVWVSTGHLTAMLRRHWGLNSLLPDHNFAATVHEKNRLDHRHHAIDAAVIASLDLGLIQRIGRAAGKRETEGVADVVDSIAPPWPTFRDELKQNLDRTIVSHRPDHGTIGAVRSRAFDQTAGKLHNETAYGLTGERDARDNTMVVHRIPVSSLKPSHLDETGAHVRDDELRTRLRAATEGLDGKTFTDAVLHFARTDSKFRGMRRVRVIEPLTVIPIRDSAGRAYKGYKGDANYRYDVWQLPDGSWQADVVSMFEAHAPDFDPAKRRPHPAAKKVLSLHQGDIVAYEHPSHGHQIAKVEKFGRNGQITLAAHNEGGSLKARDADADDPFKYFAPTAGGLKRAQARQVRVDTLGRLSDPGPR